MFILLCFELTAFLCFLVYEVYTKLSGNNMPPKKKQGGAAKKTKPAEKQNGNSGTNGDLDGWFLF